ncbi:helix-turn-helix transcriptional regulator [Micromonospora sp. WMMD1128]|uniref:helix-turn-helix domain-containing protein n=1 Tax=Micromonospora sp. WMMD1128 TaxID=3015150 RepID=UPI00248AE01F|nr:helix-turn-helix transcriptional regulator [Micromonospora sp. WMMD1128]WBB75143.1 helix-turn-helix transcriptional regulator [Micromonospora sp. WMMD1128]
MGGSWWDFIAGELRQARVRAGLSQEELARRINYSPSHVSGVETGQRPPKIDYLTAMDQALETGGLFLRMLRHASAADATPPWLRAWVDSEGEATLLRWYEPAYVPGILQTEAYARMTLAESLLTEEEIDKRVVSRLGRQGILTRAHPCPLIAVLDIMVLRRPLVEHTELMGQQLAHLVKMAALPSVQILVVPEEAGLYPALQGGFILATLSDGSVLAHLDHQVRAQVVNQSDDLASLQRKWEAVRGEALSRRESFDLIKEAAGSWI